MLQEKQSVQESLQRKQQSAPQMCWMGDAELLLETSLQQTRTQALSNF